MIVINNNIVGGDKIKKYPFYHQEEAKDCAAACLKMIVNYYDGNISMDNLRHLLKINQNGTTAYHIVTGAKKIGFEAKGVKCHLDDFNEDNVILPCIANVIVNNIYTHFVVIYKIDYIHNILLIADPANKIMKMSFDIFKSIFSGVVIMLYPNDEIPHEINHNTKLNYLIHITKSHPKLIKQVSILSLFITIFSIISSFFLESVSYVIATYKSSQFIILVLILFSIVAFMKFISSYFRGKILILLNEKIDLELMLDTFSQILLLPYNIYRQKTTGDLVTRLLDVNVIKESISKIYLTIIVDLPLTICSFALLTILNVKLSLIACTILILYIIIIFLLKDYFKNQANEIKKSNIDTTNYMIEAINNFEMVKGLHIKDNIYTQFEKRLVSLLMKTFKYDNVLILQQSIKDFLFEGGLILIYCIGALAVIENEMSFGSLLSFGALLAYFFDPIKNMVSLEKDIREFDLVLKRMLTSNSSKSGIVEKECQGVIKMINLNYSYDDLNIVLKDINLIINRGEKVIVLGPSGSGKSTLFKLLMKYYDVNRNMLFINDIDINDYKFSKGIKYISQSENLFTDSLYNNIVLHNHFDFNKVLDTSRICEVETIVSNNPLGYNMPIEENAYNLSGGEKQRIVLARTIIDKFNILIVDEAFNQMDVNLERRILKRLFAKYQSQTIIVISHRKENIDLFDRKIIIDGGVIVENTAKV